MLARPMGGALDELARGPHLRTGLVGELRARGADGGCPHVLDAEVVAGQADRRGLRHRAASLAPVERARFAPRVVSFAGLAFSARADGAPARVTGRSP